MMFNVSYLERELLKKFQNKHFKLCEAGTSVIFTGTGIGVKIEIRCNKCQKIKDITDYSIW